MNEAILAWLFLGVSGVSTIIQGGSLRKLLGSPKASGREYGVHLGMVRTAVCRVAAAGAYVAFGVTTLVMGEALPVLALIVFAGIQVMWQLNAWADVRLRLRLARDDRTGGTDR